MRTENSFLGVRITAELKTDLQAEAAHRGITLAELVKQQLNGPALENPGTKRIVTSELAARFNKRLGGHSDGLAELEPEHREVYRAALQKSHGEECKQLYARLGDYLGQLYQVPREGSSAEESERDWRRKLYDFLYT